MYVPSASPSVAAASEYAPPAVAENFRLYEIGVALLVAVTVTVPSSAPSQLSGVAVTPVTIKSHGNKVAVASSISEKILIPAFNPLANAILVTEPLVTSSDSIV